MLEFDVLVIGSGGAGMRAAVELTRQGQVSVALMTKMFPTRSATCMAQGGMNGCLGFSDPTDTVESHVMDTIKGGAYLGDQDAIEYYASKCPEALLELDVFGHPYNRQEDGRLVQRKMGGHTHARTAFSGDKSGHTLLHTVYEQVLKQGVKVLAERQLLELIVDQDRLVGVITYDLKSGQIEAIRAKAVIVATGGFGRLYWVRTSNPFSSTGDGIASCMNVGIPVKDPEMVQFHPTGMAGSGVLLSEACRGEGAYLINRHGERFMKRYDPEKMELSTRDKVAQAIEAEIAAGNGIGEGLQAAVYMDLRHLGREKILDRLPQVRQLVLNFEGIDPIEEPVPIRTSCHYSMGGIDVMNYKTGATAVPGIFAAGEASCISVHGANRLGGNSLSEILVFGKIAGQGALAYVKDCSFGSTEKIVEGTKKWQEKFHEVANRTTGPKVPELRDKMAATMWFKVGVFREEGKLQEAVDELTELQSAYKECQIGDKNAVYNTAFMNYIELGNMLTLAKAVALAALNRRESRGSHKRVDYDVRDDQNFMKHSLVKKQQDQYELSYRPVVVTKFKP